jgi:hypothetical protein
MRALPDLEMFERRAEEGTHTHTPTHQPGPGPIGEFYQLDPYVSRAGFTPASEVAGSRTYLLKKYMICQF